MLTLISPTQGNPVALKRTLESLKWICSEFIIGDVCVFEEDRQLIESYKSEYNVRLVKLPINYIYHNGFSATLNELSSHASNDFVIYLNVGEVIEKGDKILSKLSNEYNNYYIDHSQEKHRWWRCFNRHEMKWDGLIHEESVGDHRPYHKPLFTFADTDKDMGDPLKAKVYNDIKEMTYFNQLIKIVDDNSLLGATSSGWLQFAADTYESMKQRLEYKGKRHEAFAAGDLDAYMQDVFTSPEFEAERFESSSLIEYQGKKIFLLNDNSNISG
jgi:hypothetical protein